MTHPHAHRRDELLPALSFQRRARARRGGGAPCRIEPLEGRTFLSGTALPLALPITTPFDPTIPIDEPIVGLPPTFFKPNISVSFDGVEIANGDATPSASDGTSFGNSFTIGRSRTYTITNTGLANLKLGPFSIGGSFTFVTEPPQNLAASAQASFTVKQTGTGFQEGDVQIFNNVSGKSPYVFDISGTYTPLVLDPGLPIFTAPEVTVLDGTTPVDDGTGAVTFGSVVKGSASPTKTFTVRNDGDATLTLGTPALPAGFTLAEPLEASLAGGASDTFAVALDTAAVGDLAGEISFVTNDANENPFNFAITGAVTAAAAPAVTVSRGATELADGTATIDFGTAVAGGAAPTRTFTVKNEGTAPLTLGSIALPAGFTLGEGLDATLAPDASDTFTVALSTTTAGSPSGTLSIPTNDAGKNPFNFTVKGKIDATPAADAPAATVLAGTTVLADGQTTPIDFGSAALNAAGPTQTFTVRNDGLTPLTLGAPTLPAGFTLAEPLTGTLAPGATDTFQVALSTTAPGTFAGAVAIDTNDPLRDPFDFAIAGSVTPQVAAPANTSPIVGALDAGTLATTVVGGQKSGKGRVALLITNNTDAPVAGRVAGSIVASADGAVDGTDATIGTIDKTLKLKARGAKTIKVPVTIGAPAADGTFSLLSNLTFDGASAGLVAANRTVRIEKPRVTLTGTSPGAASINFGRPVKLSLPVTNAGNVLAKGTVGLELFASTDGTLDAGKSFALATLSAVNVAIKNGQTKPIKANFTAPASFPAPNVAGSYTLVVRLASSSVGAANSTDGTVLTTLPFAIA